MSATREDLKPCPFCGATARRVDIEDGGDNFGGSCIECTGCRACTAVHFDRKENLYSSWNERASDAAIADEDVDEEGAQRIVSHQNNDLSAILKDALTKNRS